MGIVIPISIMLPDVEPLHILTGLHPNYPISWFTPKFCQVLSVITPLFRFEMLLILSLHWLINQAKQIDDYRKTGGQDAGDN
jgi:hypothetical protein